MSNVGRAPQGNHAAGHDLMRSEVPADRPTERILARVWQDLLGVNRVGADDDFLALGGDSLMAMQVLARIRALLGVQLPSRAVFEARTLRQLARYVDTVKSKRPQTLSGVMQAQQSSVMSRLSFRQEARIHYQEVMRDRGIQLTGHNASYGFWLRGNLKVELLRESLARLMQRHTILRARIDRRYENLRQVYDASKPFTVPVIDVPSGPISDQSLVVLRAARALAERNFDLEKDTLLQARIFRLMPHGYALVLVVDHVVFDGWSGMVLLRDLGLTYDALLSGRAGELGALSLSFYRFADWQRDFFAGAELEARLRFWASLLDDHPPIVDLDLPFEKPAAHLPFYRRASEVCELEESISTPLRRFCERKAITLFTLGLAGLYSCFREYSSSPQISVIAPYANRGWDDTHDLVGWFYNSVLLPHRVRPGSDLMSVVEDAWEVSLIGLDQQDLPLELVIRAFQPNDYPFAGDRSYLSFGTVTPAEVEILHLAEVGVTPFAIETRGRSLPGLITTAMSDDGRQLKLRVDFSPDRYDRRSVRGALSNWASSMVKASAI